MFLLRVLNLKDILFLATMHIINELTTINIENISSIKDSLSKYSIKKTININTTNIYINLFIVISVTP